jgi:prepilin-type processing-associated H-X9-DG protein
MRIYKLPPAVFVCPGRYDHYPDKFDTLGIAGASADPTQRSNFTSPYNLSYSISLPFPPTNWFSIGYRWGPGADPRFAIMADLNPGERFADCSCVTFAGAYGGTLGPQTPSDPPALQKLANSRNHDKRGQNVLYADGHCEWAVTAFAGCNQDNIYTFAGTPGVTSGLSNQWTSASELPYSIGGAAPALTNANDSIMQPNEGDMLSTVGGLGF